MTQRKHAGRYATVGNLEACYQPHSRGLVLANVKGITSKREMDEAEHRALIAAKEKYVFIVSADTRFDATIVSQMHHEWLGSLYRWGGCYRTVEMAKGDFQWPPAKFVPQNMAAFEKEFLYPLTPCRSKNISEVAKAMAVVQSELLFVHPFREGDGRVSRWLTDLMALQSGLPPVEYGFINSNGHEHRKKYLPAVIAGYRKDYTFLARLLEEGLRRALDRRALGKSPDAPS